MNALPQMDFALEIISLDEVHPNPDLMSYVGFTGIQSLPTLDSAR